MRCHHGGGLEACGGGEREIPGLEHGDRAPLAAEPREERKVMAQGWRSSRTGAVGASPFYYVLRRGASQPWNRGYWPV